MNLVARHGVADRRLLAEVLMSGVPIPVCRLSYRDGETGEPRWVQVFLEGSRPVAEPWGVLSRGTLAEMDGPSVEWASEEIRAWYYANLANASDSETDLSDSQADVPNDKAGPSSAEAGPTNEEVDTPDSEADLSIEGSPGAPAQHVAAAPSQVRPRQVGSPWCTPARQRTRVCCIVTLAMVAWVLVLLPGGSRCQRLRSSAGRFSR